MPSAAKQKGNAWEREVAKDLSEVFNENFIRNNKEFRRLTLLPMK